MGRGLDWVTHRGPFQPLLFCDSVILSPTQKMLVSSQRVKPSASVASNSPKRLHHAMLPPALATVRLPSGGDRREPTACTATSPHTPRSSVSPRHTLGKILTGSETSWGQPPSSWEDILNGPGQANGLSPPQNSHLEILVSLKLLRVPLAWGR